MLKLKDACSCVLQKSYVCADTCGFVHTELTCVFVCPNVCLREDKLVQTHAHTHTHARVCAGAPGMCRYELNDKGCVNLQGCMFMRAPICLRTHVCLLQSALLPSACMGAQICVFILRLYAGACNA